MDFTKNLVLKENYTFFVADAEGMIGGDTVGAETVGTDEVGERGLYNRDTRFLNRYRWRFSHPAQTLMAYSSHPYRFEAHHAVIEGPSQLLGLRRSLELSPLRLGERLELENTGLEPQTLTLTLEFGTDFADLFEARGWFEGEHAVAVQLEGDGVKGGGVRLEHEAEDGVRQALRLHFSSPPDRLSEREARFEVALEPGERWSLAVEIGLENPLETKLPGPSYADWSAGFALGMLEPRHERALTRALEDLRALLLHTRDGPVFAAGIPWFVTVFGRDSLLAAYMTLPHHPEVARGTLRYLAARQGRRHDAFRAEAPGKILHEVRYGELARTDQIPFKTYYGTIDATPLFVMLLHRLWQTSGDEALLRELRPHWEGALAWMKTDGDPDRDGLLEFSGAKPGQGLSVQSWKDSHDSLSHADGTLASGLIAVSEVQGYAYAAYRAAAEFYRVLNEPDGAERWDAEAEAMQERVQQAFWLEDLGTYALALDGDKRPLRVQNSDAGQLLWSGVVPEAVAPRLAQTLLSEELFSGWGIRTLGSREARYNPVSYHNGSVWPHDTALIAGGLSRYGLHTEAATLRDALFDLAASQADLRPPELVAGYARARALDPLEAATPPVPYPVACRPQAWSAAALVYLASL